MHTWMGGISGRQGKFSGLVTEGMSSMGAMTGLAEPRWACAPAMLALVGLVGFALWPEATGKGPAWPGLECWIKTRKDWGGGRGEWETEEKRNVGKTRMQHTQWALLRIQMKKSAVLKMVTNHAFGWQTCSTKYTNGKVGERYQTPDCSKKRNLWWLISDSKDIWTQKQTWRGIVEVSLS